MSTIIVTQQAKQTVNIIQEVNKTVEIYRKGEKGDKGDQGIQGEKGDVGTNIVSVSFVADDMVFVKDDASQVVLVDAKIDLKGDSGAGIAIGGTVGQLIAKKSLTDYDTEWVNPVDISGKLDKNTAITGATKTKIIYDTKGLVTSGADATTADIADSLNKRYVTDANLTVIGNTSNTNTGDQTLSSLGAEAVANKSTSVTTDGTSDVKYPSVKAVKDYADGLIVGLLDYRGGYDASVNTWPVSGGSGTAGAVLKGDMWVISVVGTLGGVAVQAGDSIISNIDTPGQTSSNWNTVNSNISYVPEDQANKVTSISGSSTDVQYPTAKLLYDQLVLKQNALTNPVTGTGASSQVSFFNGTSAISGDNRLIWDNTNKRLGIGTTTPGAKLHVLTGTAGPMAFPYESTVFENVGDQKLGIYTSEASFGNGSALTFGDSRAQNAASKLPGFEIQNVNASTAAASYLRFNYLERNPTTGAVDGANTKADIMRITGAGNVGIGTTTPITPLEIPGSTTNSSAKFGTFELQSYAVNNAWLTDNSYYNGSWKYRANGLAAAQYFEAGGFELRTAPSRTAGAALTWVIPFVLTPGNNIGLGGAITNGATNESLAGASMVIKSGNVGIGATSPTAILHIKAGTATASTAPLKLTSGVLLTSPEVGAIEFLTDAYYATITTGAVRKKIALIGTSDSPIVGTGTSNYVPKFNGSSNTISNSLIYDDGTNVGIGTTTPTLPLHVVNNAVSATMVVQNLNIGGYSSVRCLDSVGTMKASVGYGNASSDFPNQGYFIAYDATTSLTFLTNYTERMRLTPEGNFGIGTTTPVSKFEIDKTASNTISQANSDFFFGSKTLDVGLLGQQTLSSPYGYALQVGVQAMTAFAPLLLNPLGGNVGIGTTTPATKLHIYAPYITPNVLTLASLNSYAAGRGPRLLFRSGEAGEELANITGAFENNGNGNYGYLSFGTRTSDALGIQEKMRITSAGNVGIGTSSPAYPLTVNGQPAANGYTAFTNYSDIRLKENIEDMSYDAVLPKIMALHPVAFNYNSLSGFDQKTRDRRIKGFIAQELMDIFPEMVGEITINGGKYYDTNLSDMTLYLIKAMQEMNTELLSLKKQLNIN